MYCRHCGNQLPEEARYCPHCGKVITDGYFDEPIKGEIYSYDPDDSTERKQPDAVDTGKFSWAVLGFFFPIVGLILFFVMRRNKPRTAKKTLIGAIVGAGVYTVCLFTYMLAAVIGGVVGGLTWDYDGIIGMISKLLL